ncbi:MAG: preprotein translocase subunit SecG [Planctomycetaceae bacterium]
MVALARFALGFMLVLTALFLILLVLIQRGRGGGLTGALGGAGGQSAFGTKAGDVFTRITVGVAAFWIGLCILALNVLQPPSPVDAGLGRNAPMAIEPQTQPTGGQQAPAGGAPATPPGGEAVPPSPPAGPAAPVPPVEVPPSAPAPAADPAPAPAPADAAK